MPSALTAAHSWQPFRSAVLVPSARHAGVFAGGSTALCLLVFWLVRKGQFSTLGAPELAVLRSASLAAVCTLPLVFWAYRATNLAWVRALVLLWLPLKALLLWSAPPEMLALGTGDWLPLHELGVRFANYWLNGGHWLISRELATVYSSKYLGAPYLFGVPYVVFGPYGYVVVPWLGFLQALAAILAFALAELISARRPVAVASLTYVLYCPSWLVLTNQLFREMALMVGLILFLLGILETWRGGLMKGFLLAVLGTVLTLAMREQYLVLLLGFLLLSMSLGGSRPRVVLGVLLAVGAMYWLYTTQFASGSLMSASRSAMSHLEKSAVIQQTNGDSYLQRFAQLSWYLLPVAVPLRVIAALVAPFPWTNVEVPLAAQCNASWTYATGHMLQAVLHLGMLLTALKSLVPLRGWLAEERRPQLLSSLFGFSLILSGAVSWLAFHRNILPGFLFLLPLTATRHGGWTTWASTGVAFWSIALLHTAYYLFR